MHPMFKKYLSRLTLATAAVVTAAVYSCDSDDTSAEVPNVSIRKGTATASTVSFTVAPQNALSAAYAVIRKSETVPDAATVLATGEKADAAAPKEYTVSGLEAGTAYLIVAAASNGSVYSAVAKDEMTTAEAPPVPANKPTVEIVPGQATASTLTFTVRPSQDVDAAAYVCIKRGETIPATATDIYEGGGVALEDLKTPVTVRNLQPQTEYVIAVAVSAGGMDSDVETAAMTTLKGEEQYDEVIEATGASIAVYFGNDNHPDRQTGQFALGIDNIPWNENGEATGAGSKHQFCFYSELAADPDDAVPAEGTYIFDKSDEGDAGTIGYNNYSWWTTTVEGGYKGNSGHYLDANMTLTRSGRNYEVVMTGKTDAGKTFKISYSGPIAFQNKTVQRPDDLIIDLNRVYGDVGAYNGDTGYAYNYYFQLTDHDDFLGGNPPIIVGSGPANIVGFDLYAASAPSSLYYLAIPDGTYTLNENNVPGTCDPLYTFCWHWDENGEFTQFTFSSATVALNYSDEDNTYTIKLEAVTDVGSKITCNYTGRIQMVNYSAAPHSDGFLSRKISYGESAAFGSPSHNGISGEHNRHKTLARTVSFDGR